MTEIDLDKLLDHIDSVLTLRLDAKGPRKLRSDRSKDSMDRILTFGAFPPDDPSSAARMTLYAIGETLGRVGGKALMDKVLKAYHLKYGSERAGRLSARWDRCAEIWYN